VSANWDGALLTTGPWDQPPDRGVVAEMQAYIGAHRDQAGLSDKPFELVVGGSTPEHGFAIYGHKFEATEALTPGVLVQRLFDATLGSRSLGPGIVDRSLGQLGDPISGGDCV
jgi:hypothetical protein